MISAQLQKVGAWLRPLVPVTATFFFILLSALTLPFPYIGSIAPMLGLSAIYYWAIYRPDLLRPFMVFALGVFNDMVHFLPMGLSALLFIGIYQIAFAQRRYFAKQSFLVLWSSFAGAAFLCSLVGWVVTSFYEAALLPTMPIFLQYLMTLLLFPLPAWILIRVQRSFLSQA